MNILKILKYAVCRDTVRLDANQFENSRCSVCTLLTFDTLVVVDFPSTTHRGTYRESSNAQGD